jgi:8-oxo-dGTP pyrophosphatase MutT (NUDIX family)
MAELPIRTYRAAGGIVVDPVSGRVLVLLRAGRTGPDGRAEVRLPKGHVETGETPRQTAIREVGEETGLPNPKTLTGLGQQTVEFEWNGYHIVRDEVYYLMVPSTGAEAGRPEKQFERLWLTWEEALARLTFEAEKEWVRRAQAARAKAKVIGSS